VAIKPAAIKRVVIEILVKVGINHREKNLVNDSQHRKGSVSSMDAYLNHNKRTGVTSPFVMILD
jgi:hypothetical protein